MIERSYTREQISAELSKQGASPYQAWVGSAIAMAESGGRASATNDRPGQELSLGPFQLNLLAHPDVTAECARDLTCATSKAKRISENFKTWAAWGAYTNGSYKANLGPPPSEVVKEIQNSVSALGQRVAIGPLPGSLTTQEAADELRGRFPDVPIEDLRAIAYGTASALHIGGPPADAAQAIGDALARIGDTLASIQKGLSTPFAKNLDELIQAIMKPENLWRVGFVLLGAAMIFAGARLYLTPETAPTMLKGAA